MQVGAKKELPLLIFEHASHLRRVLRGPHTGCGIAKAPVLALSGPFGAGKTSTLNLLREHLSSKTITISFSTWLPGSQETLTTYLLGDIASKCRKQYIVPGLRPGARRFAMALGQKVPLLSEYLKLLPPSHKKRTSTI